MKLVFFKEVDEIKVKLEHDGSDEEFNYIRLIEFLHDNNELEDTEYYDDISEDEKDKINNMINEINTTIIKQATEEDG
jgi:hypothetical protein